MTLSLRKATLALLGGASLVIAASGAAVAEAPNGYFDNGYRYYAPVPAPGYAEIVPVYPAPVYPAPAPVYAAPAPVYEAAPVYPPAYAAPDYDTAAPAYYEDGYGYDGGYDSGFDYVEPDGAMPVYAK